MSQSPHTTLPDDQYTHKNSRLKSIKSPSIPSLRNGDESIWKQATYQLRTSLSARDYLSVLRIHSLEEMLEATDKTAKFYERRRTTRCLAKGQPFIRHLVTFSRVLDTFISSDPKISALLWGSLRLVFELATRSTKVIERVMEMLDLITQDMPRYKEYVEQFPSASRLRDVLVSIYMEVISLNCALTVHLRRNPLRNLFRAAKLNFESEFDASVSKVTKMTARMEAEANAASMKSNRSDFNDLQRLYNHRPIRKEAILPCYYVPFAHNPNAYRRENVLHTISDLVASQKCGTFILQGLGGIGKTETALTWIYENLKTFDAAFWIAAEHPERLSQAYVTIARRLGLEDESIKGDPLKCLEAVQSWLSVTDKRWIVILDNASDEYIEDLKRYWPSGSEGAILVTTRSIGLAHQLPTSKIVEIDRLEIDQGVQFLAQLFSKNENDKSLLDNEDLVRKSVTMLDGLPLALSQMAGFMLASRCPCSQFVYLYQDPKNMKELHETPAVGSTSVYRQTIASVWNVTISSLNQAPLNLLETLAFFDADGVPERMWIGTQADSSKDVMAFRRAIMDLANYSLIKVFCPDKDKLDADTDRTYPRQELSLHRLVQIASLQLTSVDRKRQAFERAQSLLLRTFTQASDASETTLADTLEIFDLFIPHVLSVESRYREMKDDLPTPLLMAPLLERSVRYLFRRGMMRTALLISETAEAVCKEHLATNPFLLSNLYTTHGSIHRNSSRSEEGHDCYLKALQICQEAPESDERYHYLARAYGGLGNTALGLNDVSASIDFHEKGIAIRTTNTSTFNTREDNYALAVAYINVGWAYWKDKQMEKAASIEMRAIEMIEEIDRASGKPSGCVSWALKCLGNVRIAQGEFDDAFLMSQKAFQLQVEIYGYGHHETGDLLYKLAYHYHRRNHVKGAIEMLREALKVYQDAAVEVEVRGAVARTKYRLSMMLAELGEVEESRSLKHEAASIRRDLTGLQRDEKDNLRDYELLVPYWGQ